MHISKAIQRVNENLDEKLSACDGWDLKEDDEYPRVWSGLDLNEDDKKELARQIVMKYQREYEEMKTSYLKDKYGKKFKPDSEIVPELTEKSIISVTTSFGYFYVRRDSGITYFYEVKDYVEIKSHIPDKIRNFDLNSKVEDTNMPFPIWPKSSGYIILLTTKEKNKPIDKLSAYSRG